MADDSISDLPEEPVHLTPEGIEKWVMETLDEIAPAEILYRLDALEALKDEEFTAELTPEERAELQKWCEEEVIEWQRHLFRGENGV